MALLHVLNNHFRHGHDLFIILVTVASVIITLGFNCLLAYGRDFLLKEYLSLSCSLITLTIIGQSKFGHLPFPQRLTTFDMGIIVTNINSKSRLFILSEESTGWT